MSAISEITILILFDVSGALQSACTRKSNPCSQQKSVVEKDRLNTFVVMNSTLGCVRLEVVVNCAPVLGTSGGDVLRVETSVTFTWVPDPGNSYTQTYDSYGIDQDGNDASVHSVTTAPSQAVGSVTFQGVSSSETFSTLPATLDFTFSGGAQITADNLTYNDSWSWNPATGGFDSGSAYGSWDNWMGASVGTGDVSFGTSHWSGSSSDTETGHWTLAPDIHDVDVFGGAGNDTIYGGQGTETLSGDQGDDTIYAGRGEQVVFGGVGNDALHGGIGWQLLDGGSGSDTIWGGTGTQTIFGDAGNDILHGGSGNQIFWGGAGNDTIWAGSGAQILDGGAGSDVLHAGIGSDTLTGGSGRDIFAFDSLSIGHDVITDFRVGQDVFQVTKAISGLASAGPADFATHLTNDTAGAAVLALGNGTTVTFMGVSASQLIAHASTTMQLV